MEPGLSRRELLARAAVAVPVLAGASRLVPPAAAQAPGPDRQAAAAGVVHAGSGRTPRCAGTRRASSATSCPTSASSSATTRRRRRSTRARGSCACTGAACDAPSGIASATASSAGCRRARITAAIECAGNGRSFFGSQQGTPAAGSAWKLGAIGVARWRGVPLRGVLERAGVTRHAVDVLPAGPRRGGRDRRARAPAAADRQGARRRARRLRDERRAAAARPRLPGPARRAGLGRDRQHQVARRPRGRRPSARPRRGARRRTGWSAPPTRPTRRR